MVRQRTMVSTILRKYSSHYTSICLCSAPCKPFLYRERLLQQNSDMRKRNGREGCMCMKYSQSQGHVCPSPSPPPPKCDKESSWPACATSSLPHAPLPPPLDLGQFQQPRQKSRMASDLEVLSMIADIGQQQWSYTNFQLSDRTLRSRDRILEFSQELVKIHAAPYNFDFRMNFGMSGRYKQLVQYGTGSAHKSRAAWAVSSLGICMRERQHIYEDLNESSSASPGGSQQLEIPPSLNSKRTANFFQFRWFFTWRGDFNARQDSIDRLFSARRQHFVNPPIFLWGANNLRIRLFFCKTPAFWKSAYFSVRRQHFANPPIFLWSANIL
jgi:hypothetical protein